MFKFTQEMKDIFDQARPFILTTADKTGKPNGVPIGHAKMISDDEIMLIDVGMHKTRLNLAENPRAAVTFWSQEVHYGFQLKGQVRVATEGKFFDDTSSWFAGIKRPFEPMPKGVVVVKVDEAYYIGPGHDPAINLAEG